jgi:hypothetical protein
MKKYLFLLPLAICIVSCAQYKNGLVNTYGYFKESYPGAQMVDDFGKPVKNGPDTTYIIVVETKPDAQTQWTYAWVNGHSYRLVPYQVKSPFDVGEKRIETGEVVIKSKNGNELWQLITEKDEFAKPLPAGYKLPLPKQTILLQGRAGEKTVYQVIKSLEQLSALHHM